MTTPSVLLSSEAALREYEALVRPARDRFAAGRGIQGMISPGLDPRTMLGFLIHFSALSIPVTEPVEGWIRRAGERCESIGLPEVGKALKGHSKAEAGHHQYHIDDQAALIKFWDERQSPPADSASIQGHGLTSGGRRYCAVHEDNIAGPTPYCQLAIEYEIELLPVEYGPRFVQNCVRLLGPEILDCMSFVTSHIEFDAGHTKFNARALGDFIARDPDRLEPLAAAGAAALEAFGDHLTECMELGEAFGRVK